MILKKIIQIFPFLLLTCAVLPAQDTLLTPEALWKIGRVTLFDVSPDDSLVLFGVSYTDFEANSSKLDLYTIRLDGGSKGEPQRLTQSPQSEYNAKYRPDGKKIGFLRGGKMWEMDPGGGNERQVSELAMNGFAWSPDGSKILFTADLTYPQAADALKEGLPKTTGRLYDDLLVRHWDSWSDDQFQNIFYIGYQDGKLSGEPVNIQNEPFDAPLKPFGGMDQVQWSPDGKKIAYTCKKVSGKEAAVGTNSDVYLYDLETGQTENISEGMPGYDMEPVFSPNGRFLAWNSQEKPGYEADRMRVFIKDLKTGERWEMTTTMDQNAHHPRWSPAGDRIFFLSEFQGVSEIWSVNFGEGGRLEKRSIGFNDYLQLIPTRKGTMAVLRGSMSYPAEIYRFVPETGIARQITFTNKEFLENVKLGNVAKRIITTSDNQRMHSWVVYPPGFDPEKKYPAILYCQGGPQSMVSQSWSYRWNLQLFAARGYIVIAPNRRGLPGFGQAWNDAIGGDWGGRALQDLLNAIDDIAKEPYVDTERLAAMGASYGGYSVYWLAGNHQKRFKALISHCGVFNLESFYGSTEELFFVNKDLGGPFWQDPAPETYLRDSPHRYVRNWDAPLLVIHNERDYRVPLEQGLQAYTAARLMDVPSRLLVFPDENHFVLKPQNAVLWHRTMLDWLDKHLK
jgi:dipeptidyl aminopeptidase/acylaminoacyl peptidase